MATKKVKETVETVKNEAVEAAKKISKAAEPAVEAAKSTAKAAGTAAKSTAKAAGSAAKTAGKKLAAALIPEVYIEYADYKADCAELVERCKADFKSKHKSAAIHSCKLYIKPEDAMVYYVINDIADKIAL